MLLANIPSLQCPQPEVVQFPETRNNNYWTRPFDKVINHALSSKRKVINYNVHVCVGGWGAFFWFANVSNRTILNDWNRYTGPNLTKT